MPPPLKVGGAYKFAFVRLSVRTSVRPERSVSRVSLKPLPLQTLNFRDTLFWVWTCAPGYFHPSPFIIYRVMGPDFVKKFVSRASLKPLALQTWNFRDILFRVWTCAPGYFHSSAYIIYRVMALDFVKIWNFQFVSRVTLKPLALQTWNYRNILFRVWTCAPGYFHPSTFNIYRVMGLDFVSRITLKPLVLQIWNFSDIYLCPHHLIRGCIDLPVSVCLSIHPSVRPSLSLWKVCVKVECGGICVLWTHVCPLYIVICLFCKAVVWNQKICTTWNLIHTILCIKLNKCQ